MDSARVALLTVRAGACALVLTGLDLPDMSTWAMIERMRSVRPWQRWGLVAGEATADDERIARSMGALVVLDAVPGLEELLHLAGIPSTAADGPEARRCGRVALLSRRRIRTAAVKAAPGLRMTR